MMVRENDASLDFGTRRAPIQGVSIHNLVLPGSAFPADFGPVRIDTVAVRHVALSINNTISLVVDGVDVELHQPRMPQV